MKLQMSAEEVYQRIGQLSADVPEFNELPLSGESLLWLGTLEHLLRAAGDNAGAIQVHVAAGSLTGSDLGRTQSLQTIHQVMYRALAAAELRAPASARGSFIPAGNAFDAVTAFSRLLSKARSDVLIVDPYMDGNVLTDYAVLAPEGTVIRLLADAASKKAGLKPVAAAFSQQYGASRPLEVRLAAKHALHDRVLIIDRVDVYAFTQSLNAFAVRAPASILAVDTDTAKLKVAAYDEQWSLAQSI